MIIVINNSGDQTHGLQRCDKALLTTGAKRQFITETTGKINAIRDITYCRSLHTCWNTTSTSLICITQVYKRTSAGRSEGARRLETGSDGLS